MAVTLPKMLPPSCSTSPHSLCVSLLAFLAVPEMPSQVHAVRGAQSPKHLAKEQQDSSPGVSAVSVNRVVAAAGSCVLP